MPVEKAVVMEAARLRVRAHAAGLRGTGVDAAVMTTAFGEDHMKEVCEAFGVVPRNCRRSLRELVRHGITG